MLIDLTDQNRHIQDTANRRRTPEQPKADGHHERAKRENWQGNGRSGPAEKRTPPAPTLREPKPALYDELG